MADRQPRLNFDDDPLEARDAEARRLAIDPRRNVALEASAGTGKTRVLVDRYVGLLAAGIKPRHILAITFTRKAAAEMRQRILAELGIRERDRSIPQELLTEIRESVNDIAISTIDAFCLSLLHEFPLEAGVDPSFDLADETETPRLVEEALERTLRTGRGVAATEPEMALLFGELGEYQLRQGLTRLLDRRLVASEALARFGQRTREATVEHAVGMLLRRIREAFASTAGGFDALVASGPSHPEFALFVRDARELVAEPAPPPPIVQALLERVRDHFLTQGGEPRKRLTFKKADFRSARDYERHLAMVQALGPYFSDALRAFRHDINHVLARAVRQLFAIACQDYDRTLRDHGVLDFSEVLQRTLGLLSQMEEFSRSRFKLESRYQHVLVDEFQDTSRAQWTLVELLVRSWAAGVGLAGPDPTIFIVGDRKQSIYGFRDAEVSLLDEAARYIDVLRPVGQVRLAITRSFRSVRQLLHFVNDVFAAVEKAPDRADAFRYADDDTFPLRPVEALEPDALGLAASASDEGQAEIVAEEIARLLASAVPVRDRDTGVRRAIRAGDIALLFRTRDGHQVFEGALGRRRIPYYVYKGLGFFDAEEIKDVLALLSFLARPDSELRAAAFLRSRFVRISDEALKYLAPRLCAAMVDASVPDVLSQLHAEDQRRLMLARAAVREWLLLADRIPPSELLDHALATAAYAAEIAGPGYRQARENLKKIRALVRRIQNRGYATLGRIVDHLSQLVAGGDESNAIVDAMDAVNLMTTHAAKGLEFPVVFIVNLHRGSGGAPDPIRVWPAAPGRDDLDPSVSVGAHESDADRDLDAREAEEGKRLLYVAMTRARDRLYLSATLAPDGRFLAGKGGLGRTLPPTLAQLFTTAAAASGDLVWTGATGAHRLRVLSAGDGGGLTTVTREAAMPPVDDFLPLTSHAVPRVAVTAGAELEERDAEGRAGHSSTSIGVLVHAALAEDRDLRSQTGDDATVAPAVHAAASIAVASIRAHPAVAEMLAAPDVVWREYEVPFTCWTDGALVRGAIDCVVCRGDGRIQVFEFKTGALAAAHQRQLDAYVSAARALFPDRPVTGHLIYADTAATFPPVGRLTE